MTVSSRTTFNPSRLVCFPFPSTAAPEPALTHPLIQTLKRLRGNARACVYTEPMWGVPYNLFAPFASVYMLALGLTDAQIGLLASLGLAAQIVFAMLSGAVTDRLGRKRATLISDLLSWSVPCLLWAFAQDFNWFLAAALFNSIWRISMTSWNCLLVEDTDPELLVDIYSWIYMAGLAAAFFTPLAGLLFQSFSLVPTMRGLYLLAFAVMTAKFLLMNQWVSETAQGRVRMLETSGQSLLAILREYGGVFRQVLRAPRTLTTIAIMLIWAVSALISNTFWPVFVTGRLLIPAELLALYPFARAVIMLLFYFIAMPRIREMHFRGPMTVGFLGFAASQLVLISLPQRAYGLLLVSVLIEACSYATVATLMDRLTVVTVEPRERARIMAIIYVIILAVTSPFGWIAGQLSETHRALPFVLNAALFVLGAGAALLAARVSGPEWEARVLEPGE